MNGTLYCTKCGTANATDANYCFNCGQPITNMQANISRVEELIQTEEPPPPEERTPIREHAPQAAGAPAAKPSRSYNFIAKHWRGEYSLGISYWLFGFLVAIFIIMMDIALSHFSDAMNLNTQNQGFLILVYYIVTIMAAVWQIVGVLRSASAHVSRGGKYSWAVTAQVLVCLGAFQLFVSFIVNGVPLIREGFDMVRGADNIPPYSLRLLRNNTELEVSGGMPIGTTDAVRNMLDSLPAVRVIHLNSVGGRIVEANKLAGLISQHQLITYTSTSCSSACALAFLAGRERYIGEHGRIGLHSASVNGARGDDELDVNASFRQGLSRVGATPQFVAKATTTSPQDMWFPTNEELKQQNIITSVVDSRYFGLSGVADWRDANVIEQSLLKTPVYEALSIYDASNYAKLRKVVVEGVQSGRSMSDIQMDVQTLFTGSIVPNYLVHAPDLPLLRYWRSQIAEVRFLGKTNPAHCVTFLGVDNKTPILKLMENVPKDLTSEDLAALTEVIKQTASAPEKPQPFSSYDKDFEKVLRLMMAKDQHLVEVMVNPEKFSNDPAATCNSLILLYETILSMSDSKKSAGILRSMIQESKR